MTFSVFYLVGKPDLMIAVQNHSGDLVSLDAPTAAQKVGFQNRKSVIRFSVNAGIKSIDRRISKCGVILLLGIHSVLRKLRCIICLALLLDFVNSSKLGD